jgi:hypothetical protein
MVLLKSDTFYIKEINSNIETNTVQTMNTSSNI